MIKDNLLENRLNAVKHGKTIPTPPKQKVNPVNTNTMQKTTNRFFATEIYKLFQVIVTSLLYGFGIDAIFSTEWSIIQILGVGLIANHTIFNLLSILSKTFNK